VDAWQVLRGQATIGQSVVVIDWRADWIGNRHRRTLGATGKIGAACRQRDCCGETLPLYVRDHSAAGLHKLGVKVLTYMRLYGSDSDSVYLQHVSSGEAVVIDKVDTLVLCTGHTPVDELSDALEGLDVDVHVIGDAGVAAHGRRSGLRRLKVAAEI